MSREQIIAAAKAAHDHVCNCDAKYLMSCPRMAQAILNVGKKEEDSAT